VVKTLSSYVNKIQSADTDEEAKEILASFFVRSLIDDKFRNRIIDEIEKDDGIDAD
jgi:hypothetical protein